MVKSLLSVISLSVTCGVGVLNGVQPKNALPIDNGYNAISTNKNTFTELDSSGRYYFVKSSTSNNSYRYSSSDYSSLVWGNTAFDSITYNNSNYYDQFGQLAYYGGNYEYVCIVDTYNDDVTNLYHLQFTFGINTSYANTISSSGILLGCDFYFVPYYYEDTSFKLNAYYFDDSYFSSTGHFNRSVTSTGLSYFNNYISFTSGSGNTIGENFYWYNTITDYVNLDDDVKPEAINFGFTSPFTNVSTRGGFDTFTQPFYWNHIVFDLVVDSNEGYFPVDSTFEGNFVVLPLNNIDSTAYQEGYDNGYTAGFNDGYSSAGNDSYRTGYTAGYNDGVQQGGTTWLGLFGAVADTPVIMIRGLFNFDLFGMNVLTVVLSLLTALILFYLVRKLL